MNNIKTSPDPYIENETYIPVQLDWSDLNEKIEDILKKLGHFV